MGYNQLVKLNSQISRINDKLDIIKEFTDITPLISKLESIKNKSTSSIENITVGNMAVQKLTADGKYEESFKELDELEKIIDSYDLYIKITNSCNNILNNGKNLDDKELDIYVRTILMNILELDKISITDIKKGNNLINLVYKTAYCIIKIELEKNGTSVVLDKINNSLNGKEFINDFIREDIKKYDMNKNNNKNISDRINELTKEGLNYSLADEKLLLLLISKENPDLEYQLKNKFNRTEYSKSSSLMEIDSKKVKIDCKKINTTWNKKSKKFTTFMLSLWSGFVIFESTVLGIAILKKDKCNDEQYMTQKTVHNTVDNNVETIKEYATIEDGNSKIIVYDKVKDGLFGEKRKIYTYDLGQTDMSIEEIEKIDIDSLKVDSKETIKYDPSQLSKDSYSIIEEIDNIDKNDITYKFDNNQYALSLILPILWILYGLIQTKKYIKELKKELEKENIDKKELEQLKIELNSLVDEYNKLNETYEKTKKIYKNIYGNDIDGPKTKRY